MTLLVVLNMQADISFLICYVKFVICWSKRNKQEHESRAPMFFHGSYAFHSRDSGTESMDTLAILTLS